MGERWASVFGCTLMTVGLLLVAWAAYERSVVVFVRQQGRLSIAGHEFEV